MPVIKQDIMVSIVIPVKNAGADFQLLLAMLNKQEGFKEIEIIIVDSGSTDGSLALAGQYGAHIIQIRPEQFSHSYARNLGAESASGDYLLFTVQDALPPTRYWLYELFSALKNNQAAAVSCAESPRRDADLFYRVIAWNHYRFLEVADRDRIMSKPDKNDYFTLRKNGQLSDIACLISKKLFLKYKYKGDYAEDLDLGIRLIKDDHKIAFLSSTKILHSHNRVPYYYLKRGYVDNLHLTRIFPDYPQPRVNTELLLSDILFTYNALNSIIFKKLDFEQFMGRSCCTQDLADIVINKLTSALNEKYPSQIDTAGHQYSDDQFALFLTMLKSTCKIEASLVYKGDMIMGLTNFTKLIFEYMEQTYEVIDDFILADFKSSLYKAFAIICGTNLAYGYLSNSENELLEKINLELRGGV